MEESDDTAPLHPGRILLERAMRPLGVSRNQLARDIDVPVGRISDITNGKRGITADTALRLARYFGVPAQLWLRLQAEYDLHVVRTTTWRDIEPRVRILDATKARAVGVIGTGDASAGDRSPAVATSAPAAPEPPETADGLAIPPLPPQEER